MNCGGVRDGIAGRKKAILCVRTVLRKFAEVQHGRAAQEAGAGTTIDLIYFLDDDKGSVWQDGTPLNGSR